MDKRVYWHHEYLTRDGHEVFINGTNDEDLTYPVTGTTMMEGHEAILKFSAHGIFDKDQRNHPYDLIEDVTNG